jgi:uncharacterized protein (TIGR03792 family)
MMARQGSRGGNNIRPVWLPRLTALLALLVVLIWGQPVLPAAAAVAATGAGPTDAAQAASPPRSSREVIELLRLQVPAAGREAWLEAERRSWQPWLEQQSGFLGRDLLWDPQHEEATLVIRWASREQWKAIPSAEVERVQREFEHLARQSLGQNAGNPFPLLAEAELEPQ